MSAWSDYKQKMGTTRPWDLLDPTIPRASEELEQSRYAICKACPEFLNLTKQCKQCGCVMSLKTKLAEAVCPLNKW